MKSTKVGLTWIFVLALALVGCEPAPPQPTPDYSTAPAAMTPFGFEIAAVLRQGGGFTTVGPNASGQFEILPGALVSGGYKLYVYAPSPSELKIDVNGHILPRVQPLPYGAGWPTPTAGETGSGYYRVENVNTNYDPAIWSVAIRPPNSVLPITTYDLSVSNVSLNPAFPPGDPQHESAPLVVHLAPQKLFTIAVIKNGTGDGVVQSDPAGIDCGATCTFDFEQSVTVRLHASGSSFVEWGGDCSGSSPDCTLLMNGTAKAVMATYQAGQNPPGPVSNCPVPVPGSHGNFTPDAFQPTCDPHVLNQTASALCDANGYYCCEIVTGSNSTRCGANGREYPASCGDNPHLKLFPDGCWHD
jgi:hypothetical protein